jgi:polyisoprenoid-binding protein YceI
MWREKMATQTWNFDTAHSTVGFWVKHMMFAKVRGEFTSWTGSLSFDPADLGTLKVEAKIDAASINTGNEARDNHLRSGDFFDVEQHPSLTFGSSKVEGSGDRLKVYGDLTLHGVSKPVVLDVERTGSGKDPWGNERVGFHAKTTINRKDFGLGWNQALEAGGVLVGEEIHIEIEVQAIKG